MPVSFARDILPMFRATDIEHMPETTECELNEDLAFVAIVGIWDRPELTDYQLINVSSLDQLQPFWRKGPHFFAWNRSWTIPTASGAPPIPGASVLVGVPDPNSQLEDHSKHYHRPQVLDSSDGRVVRIAQPLFLRLTSTSPFFPASYIGHEHR
jgi:hypothetical protein